MLYTSDDNIVDLMRKNVLVKVSTEIVELEYGSAYLTTNFLYYAIYKGIIICSFDIFELNKKYKSLNGGINIDTEVIPFFMEKGYTPFDRTYWYGIYKLPNMVKLIFDKRTSTIRYELSRMEIDQVHSSEEVIVEAIKNSVEIDKYNYILFSGGYDSTLVADVAKQNIPKNQVGLITGNLTSVDFIPNKEDVYYSKILASKLDLSIQYVDKDVTSISMADLDNIIFNKPTSAHFSIVYQSIKEYIENQGESEYHIISGQQADSVLNFGSTSFLKLKGRNRLFEGKGDLFIRALYLSSPSYAKILFSFINLIDNEGYILSPVVGNRKLPLIKNMDIYANLLLIYNDFVAKFSQEDTEFIKTSFLMIYIFTFLSGSDASGVISTFKTDNSLPFSEKKLLWHFLKKDNKIQDKIIPKRPIMNLLKREDELWKILKTRPNTPALSYLDIFYKIGKALGLQEYQNEIQKQYDIVLPYCYNSIHLLKCLQKGK